MRHRTGSIALALWIAFASLVIADCGGASAVMRAVGPILRGQPGPPWQGFAGNAQHTALSAEPSQSLARIHWRTPVDLAPPYSQSHELFIHYGSPVVTQHDDVIVPVRTGPKNHFRVEGHSPINGALIWSAPSDYILPPHGWIPSFNPALTASNLLLFPGAGGKLFVRDPDAAHAKVQMLVFYGLSQYQSGKAAYDAKVDIDTPITTDSAGDAFFGFTVTGATPAGLQSGIARVAPDGTGTWVSAATASGDGSMTEVTTNSAPALAAGQQTVYIAVSNPSLGQFGEGYLLALDSSTLATKNKVFLLDPQSGAPAGISDSGTASPAVGPDGDVYFGVLEDPFPNHNDRGWLLHFDSTLAVAKTPGSFGWDDTPSIVPTSMVPSYSGTSSYLIMSKYNNYAGIGTGDGQNKIAILDPNATQPDLVFGNPVMKEVLTILGVTLDPKLGGVKEWCINTAAVDPATDSVLANSEDGYLYRWDLSSNSFTQRIRLTSGVGEAYTPTIVGADGQIYGVNNAVLFALGQ
ncbi:MAG TPA: hypothetical protein VID24_00410 [Candidatus Eremiobacteraceae bacterium]